MRHKCTLDGCVGDGPFPVGLVQYGGSSIPVKVLQFFGECRKCAEHHITALAGPCFWERVWEVGRGQEGVDNFSRIEKGTSQDLINKNFARLDRFNLKIYRKILRSI